MHASSASSAKRSTPTPPSSPSQSLADVAGRYLAAGSPVSCSHCHNRLFIEGAVSRTAMNLRLVGVNKPAPDAAILVCTDCGRVETFLIKPQRVANARIPQGEAGIEAVGHRKYVGGLWDQMGQLQFDYLVAHGLRPGHTFLDIGCGSLRLGRLLIPYLDTARYLGVDREQTLIDAGLNEEMSPYVVDAKRPRFVTTDCFAFHRLEATVDLAWAQSLFSHLNPETIRACLERLRPVMAKDGRFLATFFPCATPQPDHHAADSHTHRRFEYTPDEMLTMGKDTGWHATYIGDWSHPRGQHLVEFQNPGQRLRR